MARGIALFVGFLLLCAGTHVAVLASGSYGTPQSYVAIAVAAGVGCGSVCCGLAWRAERYWLALFLAVSVIAGEAFALGQTGNRLVAGSEAQQAPIREHAKAHATASAAVATATKAKQAADAGKSERLTKASEAKRQADQAIIDKAADFGCRAHCKELLQNAARDAAAEVVTARLEIDNAKTAAADALSKATEVLARMKPPESPTPLADRLGMPPWLYDLIMAGLGSVGLNGLGCGLLIFGAHGAHQHAAAGVAEGVQKPADAPRRQKLDTRRSSSKAKTNRNPVAEHAARFAVERLKPDQDGAAYLDHIRQDYRAWSPTQPFQLSDEEIGAELAGLFRGAGIQITKEGNRHVAVGISIKEATGRELVSQEASA
jgi:hypothetical protein